MNERKPADVRPRETEGPAGTESIAAELAPDLGPGDLVLLEGEVGTGKSTFARAVIRAMGIEGPLPSPTFTIGRSYRAPGSGRTVSHLDLYRLGPIEDEVPQLLGEYLGHGSIVLVEWPDADRPGLVAGADRVWTVSLEHLGGDRRRITISGPGDAA